MENEQKKKLTKKEIQEGKAQIRRMHDVHLIYLRDAEGLPRVTKCELFCKAHNGWWRSVMRFALHVSLPCFAEKARISRLVVRCLQLFQTEQWFGFAEMESILYFAPAPASQQKSGPCFGRCGVAGVSDIQRTNT